MVHVTAAAIEGTLRGDEIVRSSEERRRAIAIGIVYFALAIITLFVFALSSDGDARFGLARPQDRFADFPDLVVPASAFAYVVAVVFAGLGAAQFARGFGKFTNLILALALVIFVFAFLAWAASGGSFSLVGMFQETVLRSVPITMGALAGVMCERAGVINIAIEGMLLAGAFVGVLVGSALQSWVGLFAAGAIGGLLAWVLALLAIRYQVQQIIIGVVINIFVLGLTSFLAVRVLADNPQLNSAEIFRRWKIPILGDIPFIGPVLFDQNLFVYLSYVLVAAVTYLLFFTRWGLRVRAVGEHPRAADTLGVDVFRVRYVNVVLGGVIAGVGGAYFTLGSVGRFDENITAGRGFIALAAMIFGRWHPVGALAAALVFGFADALQQKLAILQTGIPSEFLLMAPYLVTIAVVAGLVGRARAPAADGQPYVKQ
jgi:general nucleoside transport system permease protein